MVQVTIVSEDLSITFDTDIDNLYPIYLPDVHMLHYSLLILSEQ
jgi:hypothetical protein